MRKGDTSSCLKECKPRLDLFGPLKTSHNVYKPPFSFTYFQHLIAPHVPWLQTIKHFVPVFCWLCNEWISESEITDRAWKRKTSKPTSSDGKRTDLRLACLGVVFFHSFFSVCVRVCITSLTVSLRAQIPEQYSAKMITVLKKENKPLSPWMLGVSAFHT